MPSKNKDLRKIRAEWAQRETEQSAHLFHAVFNSAQTGLMILHRSHRQIMEANPMAAMILGCEVNDLLGRCIDVILPEECVPPCDAVDSRAASQEGTMEFVRPDGALVPVLFSRTFLDGGLDELMVLSFIDISDRVAMERELRRSNEKLKSQKDRIVQSEKLASIGQLAAGVAHEINNPIGYVTSNLGTLGEYVTTMQSVITRYRKLESLAADDPDRPRALEEIRDITEEEDLEFILKDCQGVLTESMEGLHRVAEIIQNLKSFAREDSVERRAHDVNKGIESTVRMVWNELKYHCKVKKELGEIPLIHCHRGQVNQVIMNMLVNASQAMPEKGGLISITTGMQDDMVKITIADNGCGMDAETVDSIFDPFFTTKDVGQGTGLGLSISHGIIADHGGRIEVHSTPGQGTEFHIFLPVGKPTPERDSDASEAAEAMDDIILG